MKRVITLHLSPLFRAATPRQTCLEVHGESAISSSSVFNESYRDMNRSRHVRGRKIFLDRNLETIGAGSPIELRPLH
jgi:hypothetical protein